MDLLKLKTLIELVESSGIAELEIQEGEERVRITRSAPPAAAATTTNVQLPAGIQSAPGAFPAAPTVMPAEEPEGHLVKSPMVGTFYRAASPGAKSFLFTERCAIRPWTKLPACCFHTPRKWSLPSRAPRAPSLPRSSAKSRGTSRDEARSFQIRSRHSIILLPERLLRTPFSSPRRGILDRVDG